jgi:hypothetical protein
LSAAITAKNAVTGFSIMRYVGDVRQSSTLGNGVRTDMVHTKKSGAAM